MSPQHAEYFSQAIGSTPGQATVHAASMMDTAICASRVKLDPGVRFTRKQVSGMQRRCGRCITSYDLWLDRQHEHAILVNDGFDLATRQG